MVTAVGRAESLGVNALHIVWTVWTTADWSVSHMTVGVETLSCTDNRVNGITQSVVHRQIYNQVVVTAVGSSVTLSIYALHIVRRIIYAAHRCIAKMAVGVESLSCADNRINGITQRVVHRQIYHQVVVTAVGSSVSLGIDTLHVIRWIIDTTYRCISHMSIGIETLSCTNNWSDCILQCVKHSKVDDKIVIMHCGTVHQILTVNTCHIIPLPVCIKRPSSTDNRRDCIFNFNNYNQFTPTRIGRVPHKLNINPRITIPLTICIETFARPQCSVDSVADGVEHMQVYHQVVVAAVGLTQMLGIQSCQIIAAPVGVETDACTFHLVDGVADGVVNRKHKYHCAVAAVNSGIMLWIYALKHIRTVADGVGSACADSVVNRIPEGVVYRKVDNQVEKTICYGMPQVLSIDPSSSIWRIVPTPDRKIAMVTVSIELLTGTNNWMNCVAKRVVHRKKND